jgi:RNA polymerase sporulation-specific sigma factor
MSDEFKSGYLTNSLSLKKPLTAEEENFYTTKLKQGDKSAANTLVEHNLRLVAHIAKKYSGLNYSQDDLMSIGTIGLIKAVNSFDPDKGIKLGTYAVRCIEK